MAMPGSYIFIIYIQTDCTVRIVLFSRPEYYRLVQVAFGIVEEVDTINQTWLTVHHLLRPEFLD